MTPIKQFSLFNPTPARAYYNTLPIHGKELIEKNKIAHRQDREILLFFQVISRCEPPFFKEPNTNTWEVYTTLPFYIPNIFKKKLSHASVKRAMSNLKEAGYLIRTKIRRKGEYASASCYQLNQK